MPLLKGKKNIGPNIKKEMAAGKPYKQALAIALSEAGISKGAKKKKSKPFFQPKSPNVSQKMSNSHAMAQAKMAAMRKKLGMMTT